MMDMLVNSIHTHPKINCLFELTILSFPFSKKKLDNDWLESIAYVSIFFHSNKKPWKKT